MRARTNTYTHTHTQTQTQTHTHTHTHAVSSQSQSQSLTSSLARCRARSLVQVVINGRPQQQPDVCVRTHEICIDPCYPVTADHPCTPPAAGIQHSKVQQRVEGSLVWDFFTSGYVPLRLCNIYPRPHSRVSVPEFIGLDSDSSHSLSPLAGSPPVSNVVLTPV